MAFLNKIKNRNRSKVYNNNCKIIDSDPVKMYNTMYPILDIDYLNTYVTENTDANQKKQISDLFEVETIINPCDKLKCISVSFFCQNVNNTYENQYGVINFNDINTRWYSKYYVNLKKLINDFNKSIYIKTFKIRIYLENQLSPLIPKLIDKNVEIYQMKHNSIGGSPGMLWRYLVFDDKNIEVAHVFDIDENFSFLSNYIKLFSKSDKTLGRYFVSHKKEFKINKTSNAINYPVVSGGIIGFRPKQSELNFSDIIVSYILYRMLRSKSNFPNLENDTDPETIYNMPFNDHIYGWGGHWNMYGFDEKIWKHLFYPHFVKKGEVLSYMHDTVHTIKLMSDVYPSKIDYNFCNYYNNTFT
jgi:hypothetical protein